MKVLLITFSVYPSYQDGIQGIAKELNDLGHDAWICHDNKFQIRSISSDKFKYISVPRKNGLCLSLFNIFSVISLIKFIKSKKFDWIYFENVHLWNIILIIFCKKEKIASSIHDIVVHDGDSHSNIIYFIYKIIIKKSRIIFVRNKEGLESIKTFKIVNNKYVKYMPLCYPFLKKNLCYKRKGKVLFFGRLNPYKGLDYLCQIAICLPKIEFEICGKLSNNMYDFVEKCQNIPNINIKTGFIEYEKLEDYFFNCDCVILPYRSATQSGVIIDAYRFSKPVIAFDVGSLHEEIIDEMTGYLIPKANIKYFSEAIEKIERMSELEYKRICSNAYDFGYKHYSMKKASNIILNSLKNN